MFYREAGDFSTTYAQDQQTFPIRFDRYRYYLVLFVAIFVVPFIINDYWVNSLLLPFLIYAIAALGLNILVGYCGQVSLGTGGFMAVGGAFLTMSAFNSFFFEMVNGRGWICIALVVFGSWKPGKTLLGAVLFAAFDALQIRVQQTPLGADIPYQIFLMAPYILSILALVVMSRRAQVPAALMVPFNKGER